MMKMPLEDYEQEDPNGGYLLYGFDRAAYYL